MDPTLASHLRQLPQPFTVADLVSEGLPRTAVKYPMAVRFLVAPARGLYAVRDRWDSASPWERHRWMIHAAVRRFPDAIVSHTSQAVLLGLPHPSYPPKQVSMTVLDDVRTTRGSAWCCFHRGSTPPEHIVIRDGLPGFIASRTVLDGARELHPRDALAMMDGALRQGLTSLDELFEMRRHQRRWPGIASSNEPLLLADPRRESWLESASAWSMSSWGMPRSIPQVNIFTPEGELVGRADDLWPELGIVGEADGVDKYLLDGTDEASVQRALVRECVRQTGFEALGLKVIRWMPRDAVDGSEIHRRFQLVAGTVRRRDISAVFRCSCCNQAPTECLVQSELASWRRKLAQEFEPKIW